MEPHRLPQSVFAWGPAATATVEARVRSTSQRTSPHSAPSGGPVASSYLIGAAASHHPRHCSYPRSASGSPSPHLRLAGAATSSSYPVFPAYAQQQRSHAAITPTRPAASPLREAVLHTKNPLAVGTTSPSNTIKPKMHLYAADKKPRALAPHRDEEFPEVPVEWLVGSPVQTPASDSSSISLSELHSGDVSEDESEASSSSEFKSSSRSPSTPALGVTEPCHFLSVGLKALLKVQA